MTIMKKSNKRGSSNGKLMSRKFFGKKDNSKVENSMADVYWDIANVKPKIDNKPPEFDIDAYYKPRSLVADAQTIMKIDSENMELLKKINTIHRLGGKIDCWNREFNKTSPLSEKQSDANEIIEENKAMMIKIEQATGMYCTADLMREWRKSRTTKESPKEAPSKDTKSLKSSNKTLSVRKIENSTRPRCYFEIEDNHRKLGKLIFQLFDDIVPKTCENFLSFCKGFEGHSYIGTPFHRIVPGYWCQGGDVTKFNGSGGTSIYGDKFKDENFKLKHSERGILSTCNYEENSNDSKFNLTFEPLETMNGKRVVFGRVIAGFSALCEIEKFGTKNGRPIMKIVVTKCGVL